jgi:hypothetical protein
MTFIEGTVTFIEGAITFTEGAMTFTERAVTVSRAVTFIGSAITFIGGAVTFIGKGSLAIGGRLFETAEAGVADDIRINRCNLRRRLMTYKLKSPLLSINSLISTSDYSI